MAKSYVGGRIIEIDQTNKKKRRGPNRKFMVVVKDNVEVV